MATRSKKAKPKAAAKKASRKVRKTENKSLAKPYLYPRGPHGEVI